MKSKPFFPRCRFCSGLLFWRSKFHEAFCGLQQQTAAEEKSMYEGEIPLPYRNRLRNSAVAWAFVNRGFPHGTEEVKDFLDTVFGEDSIGSRRQIEQRMRK